MIATIFLGIFSILFAFLSKYKNFQWGLKVSFLLIFLFLALRYNFGNDYKNYLNGFLDINRQNTINYHDKFGHFEIGWVFLNRQFRDLGFFVMTAFLALVNCLIYYKFIKKYTPVQYYWLAVFLYIFNADFMLTHLSAMRQSIAIGLFIFSIDYLYKKDAIRYFLCIGLASLFHSSALILLPVYFLGFVNWKINRLSGIVIIILFVSLFISQKYVSLNLDQFVANYFAKYEIYKGGVELGTGWGFAYSMVLFGLVLYYERYQKREIALLFKLSIISFLFIPLGFSIMLIGRVGMYFAPATIIVYPIILKNLGKPIYKVAFISVLVFITMFSFFQFFNSDIWKAAFGTYHTIFEAPGLF